NDANGISVFFTEKRHCTHFLRNLKWRIAHLFFLNVRTNLLAYDLLNLLQLLIAYFFKMRKIKAQIVRRNQGTFLFNMCSQYSSQGVMQQVCSRMVVRRVLTLLPVHNCQKFLIWICWQLVHQVNNEVVFFFG